MTTHWQCTLISTAYDTYLDSHYSLLVLPIRGLCLCGTCYDLKKKIFLNICTIRYGGV